MSGVAGERQANRERRRMRACLARVLVSAGVSIVLAAALAGCSSVSSDDYAAVASAYPNKPLVDLLTEPRERTATSPAPPTSAAAVTDTTAVGQAVPPAQQESQAAAPGPAVSADDFGHSAASAYPTVSLGDYLFGTSKSPTR